VPGLACLVPGTGPNRCRGAPVSSGCALNKPVPPHLPTQGFPASIPVSHVGQQWKRWRGLATAGVVKVVAWERWAPVGQHADETPFGEVLRGSFFRPPRSVEGWERFVRFQENGRTQQMTEKGAKRTLG
jgi:hypothetical protein